MQSVGSLLPCCRLNTKFVHKYRTLRPKQDTFSLVNIDTGTTVRNAKYLKHAPSEYVTHHVEQEVGTETKESNDLTESGAIA